MEDRRMKLNPWKIAFFTSLIIFSMLFVVQIFTLWGILGDSKQERMYEHHIRVSRNLEILDKFVGLMAKQDVRIHKTDFLAELTNVGSKSDFLSWGGTNSIPPEEDAPVIAYWDIWFDFDAEGFVIGIRAPGMYPNHGGLIINEDSPRTGFLHYERSLFENYSKVMNVMWWGFAMFFITVVATLFLMLYEFKSQVFRHLMLSFFMLSTSTIGIVASIIWYAFWRKDTLSQLIMLSGEIVPEHSVGGLELTLVYDTFALNILIINLFIFTPVIYRWVKLTKSVERTAT